MVGRRWQGKLHRFVQGSINPRRFEELHLEHQNRRWLFRKHAGPTFEGVFLEKNDQYQCRIWDLVLLNSSKNYLRSSQILRPFVAINLNSTPLISMQGEAGLDHPSMWERLGLGNGIRDAGDSHQHSSCWYRQVNVLYTMVFTFALSTIGMCFLFREENGKTPQEVQAANSLRALVVVGQCCSATEFFFEVSKNGHCCEQLGQASATNVKYILQFSAGAWSMHFESILRRFRTDGLSPMLKFEPRESLLTATYQFYNAFDPTRWKSLDDTACNFHSIAKHFPRVLGLDSFPTKAEGQLAFV